MNDRRDDPDDAPVAPRRNRLLRLVSFANRVVVTVLDSRLHRLLSRRLLVLSYVGARTGRRHRFPVRYFRLADGRLLVLSRGTGWSRRVAGRQVEIRLSGDELTAEARLHEHRREIAAMLADYARDHGPKAASRLYLGLPSDRQPSADELTRAADRTRLVTLTPRPSIPPTS